MTCGLSDLQCRVMSRTSGAGHVIEGFVDSHANEA
jgi:hypothetical protein